jgi:hypothetical protein
VRHGTANPSGRNSGGSRELLKRDVLRLPGFVHPGDPVRGVTVALEPFGATGDSFLTALAHQGPTR